MESLPQHAPLAFMSSMGLGRNPTAIVNARTERSRPRQDIFSQRCGYRRKSELIVVTTPDRPTCVRYPEFNPYQKADVYQNAQAACRLQSSFVVGYEVMTRLAVIETTTVGLKVYATCPPDVRISKVAK